MMISARWNQNLRSIGAVIVLLLIVRFFYVHRPTETAKLPDDIFEKDPGFLESYDSSEELHRYSSVYFIETSAPFRSVVTVEPRQACAIEAAARANPRKKIIVLFASWTKFSDSGKVSFPDLPALIRFPNVHFRWLDVERITRDTPVYDVLKSEELYRRTNGAEYLSEVLRLVLLYRYGGIYLDLDVVTLKSLDFYNPNFVGAETERLVGSSVIGLERHGYGETFAKRSLDNFKYFNNQHNVRNGSFLLTYQVVQSCEKLSLDEVVQGGCGGLLEVYPQHFFHPFNEGDVELMFDSGRLEEAKKRISKAMTVHMLHRTSRKMRIDGNGKTGYEMIAKTYCPVVYGENSGNF
uniref:Alpha 1,4-glycosyltransferase domain-containing protein n=1 Tax=Anopheles farauti TaxID=69004 RepID=A0A182QVJ1_9DIPT